VRKKELGATGIQVPEIGLGTWGYRGGVEPIRKAIELDAWFLDTAEIYGTEEIVGEAIRDQREKVILASKVSGQHLKYDDVLRAADRSLAKLGIDCIDLYQVHWPNPHVPIEQTMRAMETLADRGKIRFIGVSNFFLRDLERAQACLKKHKIVSNQVKYSLLQRGIEEDMLPYCQKNRITVIAYSPLAKGDLIWGPFWRKRSGMKVLEKIAQETGKTSAQVALNWCIAKPGVVAIPKSNRTERIEENCAASGWELSSEQMEALNQAFS
jgi:diketogulonate reductase-like aldo/keto reductase